MTTFSTLESGDIFAIKGRGVISWLCEHLFAPRTDRFHFGLIWMPTGDDRVIIESIGKGIAIGRLSMYKHADIKFYRATKILRNERRQAPVELTRYGRAGYDYALYVKLLVSLVVAFVRILFKERRVRRFRAEDLPYGVNQSFVCTEAVDVAYRLINHELISPLVVPLPSAYRQAELDEDITELLPDALGHEKALVTD